MEFIINVLILILGIVIGHLSLLKKPIGIIHVDTSIPDEPPYLFLELHSNSIAELEKRGYVVLEIDHAHFAPRE